MYGSAEVASPQAEAACRKGRVVDATFILRRMLRWKAYVVGAWLILFLASLPLALLTVQRMTMRTDPPRSSQAGRAMATIKHEFPGRGKEATEVVTISCDSCTSVVNEAFTKTALKELAAKMGELHAADAFAVKSWDSPSAALDMSSQLQTLAHELGVQSLPSPFESHDRQMVSFHTSWANSKELARRAMRQHKRFEQLIIELDERGHAAGFHVAVLGPLTIMNGTIRELIEETFFKEALVIPIAIFVLILQIRSWRLAALTGFTLTVAVGVTIGLMYFPAHAIGISPVCPLMAMVMGVALSVDYSLFTCARFREELQAGKAVEEALEVAMKSAGHVIALSGFILVISYFTGILFPGEFVWTLFMAGTVTAAVVLLVQLTLTPCMIACFPSFLSYGLSVPGLAEPRGSKSWFLWGCWITTGWRPYWVVVAVYGCMLPVIWQLGTIEPSMSCSLMIPRGSRIDVGYEAAEARLPMGELMPAIILDKAEQGDIRSDAAFAAGCEKVQRLVRSTKGTEFQLVADDFVSVFTVPRPLAALLEYVPGRCPPLTCLRWSTSPPECPFLPSAKQMLEGDSQGTIVLHQLQEVYRTLWTGLVNKLNQSALIKLTPRFDTSGGLLRNLDQAMTEAHTDGFTSFTLEMKAISDLCYERMPLVLGLNLLVQSLLIGYSFGTLLAPFKLFLTVFVPIGFVYGVVVCVYQQGVLNWIHVGAFKAEGIYWITPIVTLANLLGLAVDYDIFLFSRVVELRALGYDNRTAVIGGLATTGPPITSAGLIMSIGYCGMLLGSVGMTNQIGFTTAFGVLVDTFIIRAALVPSMLTVGDIINYWPRRMPPVTRSLEDMEDYLLETGSSCNALASGAGSSAKSTV